MRFRLLLCLLAAGFAPMIASAAPQPRPIEVMIVGGYHMSNPGRDLHDVKADDVLAPKRQAEIAAIVESLARFKPDKVAVEWPADLVKERWAKFQAGTLPPSHNEVVQLGFRLAQSAHAKGVWGVDVDGDFPYDAVMTYAKAHGQSDLMDRGDKEIVRQVEAVNAILAHGTIGAALRWINDPAHIDNGWYRKMLTVGSGAEQPGADLLTAWYRRNFLICANLMQLAQPGDRIVVFYGSGHAFLLRQCVSETPGMKLVEANAYLPR